MNKQLRLISLISLAIVFAGCASQKIKLKPGAGNITVSVSKPGSNYKYVGELSATHGRGCGAFGRRGNYEGVVAILKNKALNLQANYVMILRSTPPHLASRTTDNSFGCFANAYIIDAAAYKKIDGSEQKKDFSEKLSTLVAKLKEVKRLYDDGLISKSEYSQMKRKLINEHKLTEK